MNFPAYSFAAMVYWIFIIGLVMTIIYFLEIVNRVSKKWLFFIILFPPLLLIFAIKFWDSVKAACFFFACFYSVILIAGKISGYPMAQYTFDIIQTLFLWPIIFVKKSI